jgi:peptide/nickel transport system permease protein
VTSCRPGTHLGSNVLAFTLKRIGAGIVLVVVIPTIAFFLMHLNPGDTARNILGPNATPEQVAKQADLLGLNHSVWQQFTDYARHAVGGDFGSSYFTGESITDAMTGRVPVTLSLVLATTVLAAVLSAVLGVAAAVRRGWVDRLVQIVAVAGFALPGFWIALILVMAFAVRLPLFPATGYVPLLTSPTGWVNSLVLPVAALTVGAVANAAQQIRGEVIDTLRQDWVRTLRSRGLSEPRVLYRHVLRNAGASGLTVLGLQSIGLLGGAVFVEQIFSLPGIGQVLVTATSQGDIPMVMGVVTVTTVIVVAVNLLIDLSVAFLNPKARLT